MLVDTPKSPHFSSNKSSAGPSASLYTFIAPRAWPGVGDGS